MKITQERKGRRTRVRLEREKRRTPSDMFLAEIGLSTRAVNQLERCGVFTVADLLATNEKKLRDSMGIGVNILTQCKKVLCLYGPLDALENWQAE